MPAPAPANCPAAAGTRPFTGGWQAGTAAGATGLNRVSSYAKSNDLQQPGGSCADWFPGQASGKDLAAGKSTAHLRGGGLPAPTFPNSPHGCRWGLNPARPLRIPAVVTFRVSYLIAVTGLA